jgi:hypothetical protein
VKAVNAMINIPEMKMAKGGRVRFFYRWYR